MYLENIITPHYLKTNSESPERLSDAANLKEIASITTDVVLSRSNENCQQLIDYAEHISNTVFKSLWFLANKKQYGWFKDAYVRPDSRVITPDNLNEHQVASCSGFAILTSEALEKAKIEHFVAFSNQHSFVVLPDKNDTFLYLVDSLSPDLNQKFYENGNFPSIAKLKTDIKLKGRADIVIDPSDLTSSIKIDCFSVIYDNPWLSNKKVCSFQNVYTKGDLLKFRLFTPTLGRYVLENYLYFVDSLEQNNISEALKRLNNLGSNYPDVNETINLERNIKKLLVQLGRNNEITLAGQAIETYLSSFDSKSHLTKQHEGDYWRIIAKNSRNKSAAKKAKDCYAQAKIIRYNVSDILNAKLLAATNLFNELEQVV